MNLLIILCVLLLTICNYNICTASDTAHHNKKVDINEDIHKNIQSVTNNDKHVTSDDKLNKHIIKKFQKWTVLNANPENKKVCYAVIYSSKRIGNYEKSDTKPYFMVHYFAPYHQRVSVFFDYELRAGSNVILSIDGQQFILNEKENYAISQDSETDTNIIKALLHGTKLLIRGDGLNGKYTVDEYRIDGFDLSYRVMRDGCVLQQSSKGNDKIK